MASLVIIIFFTHPSLSSSNVHSSFFSIGGGFFIAVDCEYMIGVAFGLLLLLFLESDRRFAVEFASEPYFLLVSLDNEEIGVSFDSDTSAFLLKFLDIGSCMNSSELLLRFWFLDNDVGVLLRRLVFLDNDARGLGVGVLLLRLLLLENALDMFAKNLSSTLWCLPELNGVVGVLIVYGWFLPWDCGWRHFKDFRRIVHCYYPMNW